MTDRPGEPTELAELALDIAREAGSFLLPGVGAVEALATKSSPHDLVTAMDRDSEDLVRRRIQEARPDDQVVGEEQGTRGAASSVRWIVDPLDGTVNYFYGQPSWAVSIGVEIDGFMAAGAVVAPALGEEYLGIAGSGSWTIEQGVRRPLRVSEIPDLADAVVSTGFGYVRARREQQAGIVAALLPQVRDIRRVGAAAVDLCWVARGRIDAHYERGLQDWDRAAGSVIAAEAGAVVAGLRGTPASADLLIAANPQLYRQLDTALAQLRADSGD